jgi:hypothetical protein
MFRTVVQVGPPVQLFLDRRAGTLSFNRGPKLAHRATGQPAWGLRQTPTAL